MNKVVQYVIAARDTLGNAVKSILARIKSAFGGVFRNLANIQVGLGMLSGAATAVANFLKRGFHLETTTRRFKVLLGSIDAARQHMEDVREIGRTSPFDVDALANASRQMLIMSDGAIGFKSQLKMVAEAAVATGQPIETLAHEVGRAYAVIRDGQPLTRATMTLRNMGAISPELAQRLDDMQKAGATTTEIWHELEMSLKRFGGAMDDAQQTGAGLLDAVKSEISNALDEMSAQATDATKGGLSGLLDAMKHLREDGTLSVWANQAGRMFSKIYHGIADFGQGAWKWAKATFGVAGAFVGGVYEEIKNGGSVADIFKAGVRSAGQMWQDTWNPQTDENERAADIEERKQRAAQKATADREREQAEDKRKLAALEAGQRKANERTALERLKQAQEIAAKAAQDEKAMRESIMRENVKIHREQMKQELAEKRKAERLAEREAGDAQKRLAAARERETSVWGWYRDRDAWAAQLDDERANAEAEKQFEKDFGKLKDKHRDWRTAKLSDNDELVRRVAISREEKAQAEEYARTTAEAWAQMSECVERIEAKLES